ncbi:outer membrane beta-barrel protein [Chryseobacterium sp. M5A1_1a]
MLLKKTFFILFLIIIQIFNAQRKKTDTLYVYEKVIVYDTIYLEKALKIQSKGIFPYSKIINRKEIREVNPIKDEVNRVSAYTTKKFQFGVEIGTGLKTSTWARESSKKNSQSGFSLGLWASKSIFNKFSLMLSAHVYRWNSTFDLDANKEDTWLNGYYFTEDSQPLLFQRFNNKHFEYVMQLKLSYDWKNIRPFIGILANKSIYKMQFLVPENMVLNRLDDFKSEQLNVGFSLGVQYKILKKILLSLEYQEYKMKNVSLKNSSFNFDIFKTNNTFAERKINLGISYIISGR